MTEGYDLVSCLGAIDPTTCNYDEWLQVGMALHAEGMPVELWQDWSRADAARYHEGECGKKWSGFGHGSSVVKGGTLVQMARDNGWIPVYDRGEAIDWDAGSVYAEMPTYTPTYTPRAIVDPSWVEADELAEPGDEWRGSDDLVRYLEALFEPGQTIGYVVESWDNDGRWVPASKGPHSDTAGEIIKRVRKYGEDFASSVGWNNAEAGAWIRFNPLDGEGVRDANVTDYRYSLIESDDMAIGRQLAIIKELELPIAALVHSGNKSLHAIVRVDAKDYDEYRKRVDVLYRTCKDNGLKVDTNNKNPSRLSRMPGVTRSGRKQWLIATNIGRESWEEWREWIAEQNDDLPDPESLAGVWDDLPELSPPLINGVLRQGHKMTLGGPSKAGKSFALIELCVSIAEGMPWLGFDCAQGRVLYVNLELDRASCLHRFKDVYKAMGAAPANLTNIEIWNLRGKSKPMDQLAPSLIRRALKTRPIAVVIDPIYKVITGDENSADQMAAFCNQFDRVATELGCAVVYCHHHSKGSQGSKRSMDRVSGSGVFARDPDALLDMIELEQTDALRKQLEDTAVCAVVESALKRLAPTDWQDRIADDDRLVATKFLAAAHGLLGRTSEDMMLAEVVAARAKAKACTAWRIEGTLREFPRFDPLNLWFDYPTHKLDNTGALSDLDSDGGKAFGRGKSRKKSNKEPAEVANSEEVRGTKKKEARDKKAQEEKLQMMRDAIEQCRIDGVKETRTNMMKRIEKLNGAPVSRDTVVAWTSEKAPWSTIRIDPQRSAEGILIDSLEVDLLTAWEGW